MVIVYRLLNDTENPSQGLRAKNPFANISVAQHVGYGSAAGFASQYISTTSTYIAAHSFAQMCRSPVVRIVRIDLDAAQLVSNISVIDLTNPFVRQQHIDTTDIRANNFSSRFQEILVVGFIPASCVQIVYSGSKNAMPLFPL